MKSKLNSITTQASSLNQQLFDASFQIAILYHKLTKVLLYIPDALFVLSLINPQEFHTRCIIITQSILHNITLTPQITSAISDIFNSKLGYYSIL